MLIRAEILEDFWVHQIQKLMYRVLPLQCWVHFRVVLIVATKSESERDGDFYAGRENYIIIKNHFIVSVAIE